MPLTKSGKKVLRKFVEKYGSEKGRSVFYAEMNKKPDQTKKWKVKSGKEQYKRKLSELLLK